MSKQRSTPRSAAATTATTASAVVPARAGGRTAKVTTRLGTVTVSGQKPSAELVRGNVARSTQALERVRARLAKPGIYLPEKKGVPRYAADENVPGLFIRRLNGTITTGRLENGEFVEIE